MLRRASRSGRATPSPRPRVRQSGMPWGPNSMVRLARRCGPRRPSMSSVRRSMSRQGTTIPTLPRKRATRFLRLSLQPVGCSGIGRLPQTTASSRLASVIGPTVRKAMVQTDFGQSPILVSMRSGQRVLVVGQKSGVVHALDPDQEGKILWQTRVGKGGPLGGIMWGSAADQDHVYVANSDVRFSPGGTLDPNAGGGLFGLDLATGKISMQVPPVSCGSRSRCSPALSAAVTVIPGVVFSGGMSGYLRAYATDDARLLWEVDTARDYPIVNGVSARGGAMDGPSPTIVDGMLYVNSGYAQWGGLPGNVLLAFEVRNP